MSPLDKAIQFLHDLERGDLARLLERARYEVVETTLSYWCETKEIHLHAPAPYDEAAIPVASGADRQTYARAGGHARSQL